MSLHLGLVKAEGLSEPSGLHLQRLSAHSCLDVSSRSQIQHVSEETHHRLWPKTGFLSWLSDSCSFCPRPSDHLGSDTVPSPIHSFPSPFISNPVHVSLLLSIWFPWIQARIYPILHTSNKTYPVLHASQSPLKAIPWWEFPLQTSQWPHISFFVQVRLYLQSLIPFRLRNHIFHYSLTCIGSLRLADLLLLVLPKRIAYFTFSFPILISFFPHNRSELSLV